MSRSYEVGTRTYKVTGAVCGLFFIGCSIGAIYAQAYGPVVVFAIFVVMGAYLLLTSGSFELSETSIEHKNAFGRFGMRWSDISQAEFGPQGSIVLHGEDQRLVVAPVSAWSGPDKAAAIELLCTKLDAPKIESFASNWADFKCHRNVRI
ncbi:MAG TPA: hypothetical protein VF471_07620 [Pseudoxanthomonas sp.]